MTCLIKLLRFELKMYYHQMKTWRFWEIYHLFLDKVLLKNFYFCRVCKSYTCSLKQVEVFTNYIDCHKAEGKRYCTGVGGGGGGIYMERDFYPFHLGIQLHMHYNLIICFQLNCYLIDCSFWFSSHTRKLWQILKANIVRESVRSNDGRG